MKRVFIFLIVFVLIASVWRIIPPDNDAANTAMLCLVVLNSMALVGVVCSQRKGDE